MDAGRDTKPPSIRQITANRENARKSTGPKTAEGKSVSKMNAVRHGLRAQTVVIRNEDATAFDDFRREFIDEYHPIGPLEQELVETIVAYLWRLRRAHVVEAGIFEMEYREELLSNYLPLLDPKPFRKNFKNIQSQDGMSGMSNIKINPRLHDRQRAVDLASAFMRGCNETDAFIKLSRYETAIARSLFRTLHKLERLQTKRQKSVRLRP